MTLYLSGTVAYGLFLLVNKFRDRECSKTDPISWLVIAIASTLWVVVLPISLIELKGKSQAKLRRNEQTEAQTSQEDTSYVEATISVS